MPSTSCAVRILLVLLALCAPVFGHLSFNLVVDAEGNLLVAELSGRIRKIEADGVVSTVAGAAERGYEDGTLKEARFGQVFALGLGPEDRLYVAELGGPEESREYRVRVLSKGRVRTVARIPTKAVFRK